MGAGTSQNKDEKEAASLQNPFINDAKPVSAQVSLPHNWEAILEHANSPIDKSSTNLNRLCDQLHTGIFLNQNRKKYWVDRETNNNCFMLFARDLSITWADDNRYWKWPLVTESSDVSVEVGELLNVCWLEVHGRFDIASLSPGTTYEIVFVVKINDPSYGWEVPLNVRLTSPCGNKQEHKENLMEKPRGRWIQIHAGEFNASNDMVNGELEFSLYEYEGGNWKKGLVIKGVSIQPKA